MTIKFFGLIPRRAGMSTAEFHDHYRHPHGTLGLALPTIKRYVQSHQIHTELLDESQSRFEAVAEDWFDTVEDAVGLSSDPHYLEHIQPDEPLFVDLDNLKWLNTREQFIADRDGDLAGVAGGGHGGEVRAGEDVDVRPADHDHAGSHRPSLGITRGVLPRGTARQRILRRIRLSVAASTLRQLPRTLGPAHQKDAPWST